MRSIVIIGGGITGLSAAHRILEHNQAGQTPVEVRLLEAGPRVGGIIQTVEREGFLLERGPDAFISEKPEALNLARKLGLEPHLIETNQHHRRSFIVRDAKLLPVPEGFSLLAPARLWPFVTSDIFSWPGKARIALDLLLPRRNAGDATDESLAHFVRRRLGSEALERMAQPMVAGIYTADPELLSLKATMPRFLDMEQKYRSLMLALRRVGSEDAANTATGERTSGTSGARYSLFLSFDQGMQLLSDTLSSRISQLSGSQKQSAIHLNTRVDSVELTRENDKTAKWRITTNAGETLTADAVCLTLPSYACARLLRGLDASLAAELEGIPYASSVTINLAYKREEIPHPLDGFGFVVPHVEKRTLMACTFSSVKFTGRAPEGFVLLRAFAGGALQPELLDLTEAELMAGVRRDLEELLGIHSAPLFSDVTRWDRSMPQYHLGHLGRLERIEQRIASLPGLSLAGNAYTGLGIPDCIRSGESAADKLGQVD